MNRSVRMIKLLFHLLGSKRDIARGLATSFGLLIFRHGRERGPNLMCQPGERFNLRIGVLLG